MIHWLLLPASGLVAGLTAGLFGIGGGVVLVPFLRWFLPTTGMGEEAVVRTSVGTSLGAIAITTFFTSGFHLAEGRLNRKELLNLTVWVLLGVLTGALITSTLPAKVLRKLFAVFLLFAGTRLLLNKSKKVKVSSKAIIPASAYLSALSSASLGVGGGIVVNSLLFNFTDKGVAESVAVSSAVSFMNALAGACIYCTVPVGASLPWQVGGVYAPAALLMALGALPGSRLGLYLLHHFQATKLKKVFGVFLLCIAVKVLL